MKKKSHNDEELKIGEFIKEPASLKLLILAGTNIRPSQLPTINRCVGLIKLDLSSNFLGQVPLKFSLFSQLKILYLHDNQLTKVDIAKTSLQYISLFSNPIRWYEYRQKLIQNNKNLLAIDKNVISEKERVQSSLELSEDQSQVIQNKKLVLPVFTELKWPIVEISASLEQEEDYLNLLKAEIFVINNVYKRTNKIQYIQSVFKAFRVSSKYQKLLQKTCQAGGISQKRLLFVMRAAKKWKQYTLLRRKLRKMLEKKGKQHLLNNQIEENKRKRGEGVNVIMDAFLPLVRQKMNSRAIFQRNVKAFRQYIPSKKLFYKNYLNITPERDLVQDPVKLYFKDSEYQILSKVTLYAKKLLFQQKEYDLCDQFTELFKATPNKYYIFRSKQPYQDQRSWLKNTIHETIGMVTRKCDINRKHFLYNRNGHKSLTVKSLNKFVDKELYYDKMISCDKKLDYLQSKYDRLIQYKVSNWKILELLMRIVRYINAGNSSTVVLTQTAYFQTQVHFDDDQKQEKQKRFKFYMGIQFYTKRVNAANVIQRFWRKKLSQKHCKMNIIESIKNTRANNLITKWFSSLIFQHRMIAIKMNSYIDYHWRHTEVYLHLDIYINIPEPTNYLRYPKFLNSKEEFYDLFHKETQVQIIESNGRKWLKICYPTCKKTATAQKQLFQNTFRYYYNGFSLKLFTAEEIKDQGLLENYEKRVLKMYGIRIQVTESLEKASILWIDNLDPSFIWSEMQLESTRIIFEEYEKKSTNVSIFIYNKHKRPLKVSCEFMWVQPQSIYLKKRKIRSVSHYQPSEIRSHQNSLLVRGKQSNKMGNLDDSLKKSYHVDLPVKQSRRRELGLKSSGKKGNSLVRSHRSRIVSDPRLDLLSETLNIRRK